MAGDHDVTDLLARLEGSPDAVDRLFPIVYDELRAIAQARLRAERAGHTLSGTALVHEAYLRLVGQRNTSWKNRTHFFAIAARAMRRVLVDHAVARRAEKRGGGAPFVTLHEDTPGEAANADELLAIDQALTRLADLDPRQARVVELRFFAGLSLADIAEVLHVSRASVNRDWRSARAFLTTQLSD